WHLGGTRLVHDRSRYTMGPIAITLRPGLSAYLTPGLVPYRWRPRMGNSVLPATVFSRDGHVHVGGTAVSTPIWGPERLGPMDRYYQPIIWPLHDRRHPQRHADAGTITDRPVLPQPRISTTAYPVGLYPVGRIHRYQTTDRAGVTLRRAVVGVAARPELDWAQWIVITNPLFGLYMIAGTHNDTLMLGLLLTGLYFLNPEFQRRRILWGFILLGGSIAIKPLTVLVLPFAGLLLVWQPDQRIGYRSRVKVWAASLLIVGSVLTIFGAVTGLWFGWIQAMTTSRQAAFPYAPFGLLGLGIGWIVDAVLHTGIEPADQVFYSLGTLIAAAITAWLALL